MKTGRLIRPGTLFGVLLWLGATGCAGEGPEAKPWGSVTQGLEPGVYYLQAVHAPERCLDVSGVSTANGANIQQWACADVANQKWQFIWVQIPLSSHVMRPPEGLGVWHREGGRGWALRGV
jgi:hypothetical protein